MDLNLGTQVTEWKLKLSMLFPNAFSISNPTSKPNILFETLKQPSRLLKTTFENKFESQMNFVQSFEIWPKHTACTYFDFLNLQSVWPFWTLIWSYSLIMFCKAIILLDNQSLTQIQHTNLKLPTDLQIWKS